MSVEDDQGHGYSRTVTVYEPPPQKRPWALKYWNNMSESDKHALREHLSIPGNVPDLLGYKKYLRDWCEVPAEWLGITRNE